MREPAGELRVGVFGSEADYRKTDLKEVKAPATGDPVTILIPDLAAGEYALAGFHDKNSNQKLDSTMLGIPKEPYGFSGSVWRGRSAAGHPGGDWRHGTVDQARRGDLPAGHRHVNVVTAESEALIREPLRDLLPQLDHLRFNRIRRSRVGNLDYVQSGSRDQAGKVRLTLHGRKERLLVSRLHAHLFRAM